MSKIKPCDNADHLSQWANSRPIPLLCLQCSPVVRLECLLKLFTPFSIKSIGYAKDRVLSMFLAFVSMVAGAEAVIMRILRIVFRIRLWTMGRLLEIKSKAKIEYC